MTALPTKYVPVGFSMLGVSALILEALLPNDTVSTLWDRVSVDQRVRTFDRFADALTLLYAAGLIEFRDGIIGRGV